MALTRTSPPCILLVEDDAISREVLTAAVSGLPAEVTAVTCLADARVAIASRAFDAWLVDAHLPDGDGRALLDHCPATTIPLAHTAATDPQVRDGLMTAGFREVLVKPIAAPDLQRALRRVLDRDDGVGAPMPGLPATTGPLPVWDDAAALRALAGNAGHVRALRGLFVGDLVPELDAMAQARAAHDADAIRARVHRLRASCGFVGAARVAAQLPALEATPFDAAAFDALAHAMRDTGAAWDRHAVDA